jgi:hypothetical protein
VSESSATRLLNRDVLDGYPPNERLVIFVLALMENSKAGAYPSDRTLARKCGVGQDTVRAAKARAEADGVICRAVPPEDQPPRTTIVYTFSSPARTAPTASAVTAPGAAPENGPSAPESLASIGTAEQLGEQRASAQPSETKKIDTREEWQVRKDAEAAAEAERTRPRTEAELALIAERQRQRDEDDARHTAERDAELAELTPEGAAFAESLMRKHGITNPTNPEDKE